MTSELTVQEMFESLNGYEELAIEKAFGHVLSDWMPDEDSGYRGDQSRFARALVFVAEKRAGKKDADAKQAAMELSVREVSKYFTDPPEEIDPDEPETPEGKDD